MSVFVTVMKYLQQHSLRTYLELFLFLLAVLIVARLSFNTIQAVNSPTIVEVTRGRQ